MLIQIRYLKILFITKPISNSNFLSQFDSKDRNKSNSRAPTSTAHEMQEPIAVLRDHALSIDANETRHSDPQEAHDRASTASSRDENN